MNSRTLTYTGLTDFGDDGPQSSNVIDLASQGLVLMFQSITEKYSQPIAVFASKNQVAGEDLARLVVKAICLLEESGAIIHSIISDGASTNKKIRKILDVKGSLDECKKWFTHPRDETRKILMFSDAPHLIKCIRNRLHDRLVLKVRYIIQHNLSKIIFLNTN